MKRVIVLFLLLVVPLAAGAQKKIIIKLGTVAPEGSTYMDVAHQLEKAVEARSGGRVDVRWYAGGVLGDEPDMIRLMKLGQLHGAGLTGMGLGQIDIAIRAVELPFLMKNYSEVDKVLNGLFPVFKSRILERGFVIIGIAENGFVYFFGKRPIRTVDDIRGYKMWVWAADSFAIEAFKSIPGVLSIPLPLTDVLTALATGIIEGFYNTPLAAVALQWTTRVKYMLDIPVVYGSAWFIMEKRFFDSLPADIQRIIVEVGNHYFNIIRKSAREDNKKALKAIAESGIEIIKPSPEEEKRFGQIGLEARKKVIKKFIPPEIMQRIEKILGHR